MLANQKYGPQLRMSIVHCSSQDEVFPITELQSRTMHTSGWQSAKYCEYPQELGFRFEGEVDVQHLRILCHESKIPSRIEIFIAEATDDDRRTISFPSYEAAVFRRLGHINLASNEENNFAARELKTINVRRNAIYLKLIIRKNHSNLINVFNQVGLVALSSHGSVLSPFKPPRGAEHDLIVGGEDEVPMEHIFVANRDERERAYQQGGLGLGNSGGYAEGGGGIDDTHGGTLDPITGRKVKELTLHKARAIEQEDYDLAKALKDQIDQLRLYGAQIAVLEAQKLLAVEAEEYDKAKALKLQIDELRARSNARPGQAPLAAGVIPPNVGGLNQQAGRARHPPTHVSNYGHGEVAAVSRRHAEAEDSAVPSAGPSPMAAQPPTAFDDQPVGGGGGGGAVAFDDRPAMAGRGAKGPQIDEYPPGYSPPAEAEAPPAAKPAPKRSAAPAAARTAVASHSGGPSGNDELACTARGDAAANDETGGIVVKAPGSVAIGKVAAADGAAMPQWERRINAVTVAAVGEHGAPEVLPNAKLTENKDYVSTFGNFVTCCLFSKRWQLREASLRAIASDEGYAVLSGEAPQGPNALPQLLLYLGAKGFGVDDSLANVFFAACDALSLIVAEQLTAKGSPLSSMTGSILPLLPVLMLKAGDNNARVREKAAQTLMSIATSPIGAERISSAALAEPETGGSKKPLGHRVHLARLHLVQSLIEAVGLKGRSGLTVEGIMQRLCVPCLGHSHQDVREASQKLAALLFHYSSPAVMEKFLAPLKPAQRQLIDEQVAALEAAGGPPPPGASAPQTTSASPVSKPRPKKAAEPEMVSSSFSVGQGQAEVLAAARAAVSNAGPPKKAAAKAPPPQRRDPDKVCQYCNAYDERFTEDNLDLHLVRDCPMLCPCPLCGQVTEISQLQPHLVNECDRRSLVKQCPLCLEAVRAEDLEPHVEAAECIRADPSSYSLCPLCHAKFPAGPEGWLRHFASSPGCPNNPRPWDGGDIGLE